MNPKELRTMRIYILITILLIAGFAQAATITVCPNGCDHKSIQTAVYAAKTNDTIELHSGTYNESVFLTKELKFIGNDTGNGEPVVAGELYTQGYRFSLRGFGFNSIRKVPNPYSAANDSIYYWLGKTDEYISAKSYTKALEAISNALKMDPHNVVALNKQGIIFYSQGRYEEAIASWDNAIKIDPSFDGPWNNKGDALYRLALYEQALACYDKAINADPRDDYYWTQKSYALLRLAKYEDALKASNKAIELSPQTASHWLCKSNVLFLMGKYDDALTSINTTINLNPDSGAAWQLRGLILQTKGQNLEANAAMARARELGYEG